MHYNTDFTVQFQRGPLIMQLAQQIQEVLVHYFLTKLLITHPPPHLNHHVLHSSRLLTLAEADVETSWRLHLFHLDFYQLSSTTVHRRSEAFTLQGIQGKSRPAMHLNGRIHL